MATSSQRHASGNYRRRAAGRGLVRVEVQAPKTDAALIKAVAETLRGDPKEAQALRSALERALDDQQAETAFDIFGSDLPDHAFEGVFDQPRLDVLRKVEF